MKRVTLTVVAVLLAVPLAAHAKVGVEFQQGPGSVEPGKKTDFTMMVMREPSGPNEPPRGEPEPVAGVRPLATFRNAKTGEVVRVRGGRTDRDGIAHASIVFPSRGRWDIVMTGRGVPPAVADAGQDIEVGLANNGVTVMEVVRPPADAAAPIASGGGFPWALVAGVLAAMAALAAVIRVGPRRLRSALPAWLGGGA
jgi:hypothetical protein